GFASLEPDEELPVRIWHVADEFACEFGTRLYNVFCGDTVGTDHACELGGEHIAYGLRAAVEDVGDGPALANEMCDERAPQAVVDALVRLAQPHAEEIARMLTVECCDQLPAVQVLE